MTSGKPHAQGVSEEQIRDAIRLAWTHSGTMLRINDAGPYPVIEPVGLHEFTSLVLTYAQRPSASSSYEA